MTEAVFFFYNVETETLTTHWRVFFIFFFYGAHDFISRLLSANDGLWRCFDIAQYFYKAFQTNRCLADSNILCSVEFCWPTSSGVAWHFLIQFVYFLFIMAFTSAHAFSPAHANFHFSVDIPNQSKPELQFVENCESSWKYLRVKIDPPQTYAYIVKISFEGVK